MAVIDSSVLVAAFNKDDALHAAGVMSMQQADKPIGIPEHVAAETATVLAYKAGKNIADTFVRSLYNSQDTVLLPSSSQEFLHATEAFLSISRKTSFVDALLLALSRSHPVLTFDENLLKTIKKQGKA